MGNDQSNLRKGDKAEPGEIGVNPVNAEVENSPGAYGFTIDELKEWAVELQLDPGSDDPFELLSAITYELINIELVKLGIGNGENGATMKASGHESVTENVETSVNPDMEVEPGTDSESEDISSEANPSQSTKRKHEEEDEENSGDSQSTSCSKCVFKVRKVCPQGGAGAMDGREE